MVFKVPPKLKAWFEKGIFFGGLENFRGCGFVPYTFSETKPQMVPMDPNIGSQGLALI